MGFNSVFRILQEVFPQVAEYDVRLLRAVAVEHSKDADAAVEAVLVEVIPFLSERSTGSVSSTESAAILNPREGVILANSSAHDEALNDSFHDANSGDDQELRDDGNEDLISLEKIDEGSTSVGPGVFLHFTSITDKHANGATDNHDDIEGNIEREEVISPRKFQESHMQIKSNKDLLTSATLHQDSGTSGSMNAYGHANCEDFDRSTSHGVKIIGCAESNQKESRMDGDSLEEKNYAVSLASLVVQECVSNDSESILQFVVPDMLSVDSNKPDSSCSNDTAPKEDISTTEMVDLECETALDTVVTRSGQICSVNFLEDMIEDARSNKKTMFSVMETVIGLMREVEARERVLEQAKEEAAKGGLDILSRVEDLKQMLQHAREANDMHAGEVYGEKAILATEVRELQSRLLSLSDERDKSLAILDEMRQALEERLAVADKERKAAEQEKQEKENSEREALTQQELIMEKVVQESQILKQEAEENAKLREFLINRGRIVDMLQGEISVICQDVKLLKEKFDDCVPLSKSFSSSQTSCILASSSSSLKSLVHEQVLDLADSAETARDADSKTFVGNQLLSGVEKTADNRKALADEGWEFFDDTELNM